MSTVANLEKNNEIQTIGDNPQSLLTIAIQNGASVEQLEKLLLLKERWDAPHIWYKNYLGRDVGLVTVPSQEEQGSVQVRWSNDERFFYHLKELKILGEV